MKVKFIIILVLCINCVFAQLQNNTWYFSPTNKGISFDVITNIPSVVTGHAPLSSLHGCGIASNPTTGAVMFYSDGVNVYDNTNTQMPNGLGLLGGVSCAEKGEIVQMPDLCNKYYVFSNNANSPASGSIYYSVIDMSLPGNGTSALPLGDVESATKNTFLTSSSTEALTIVPNPTNNNFWLIVPLNGSDEIKIYLISSTGINFVSSFFTSYPFNSSFHITYSETAGKLAYISVVENEPALIMNFNSSTGFISSVSVIPGTPVGTSTNIYNGWHDVEFSPDGSKLYLSKYRMFSPVGAGRIYQYDLSLPLFPITSVFIVPSTNNTHTCTGLNVGPDGKIYFIYINPLTLDDRIIGVISSPNSAGGLCNVNSNVLDLGVSQGGNSRFSEAHFYSSNSSVSQAQFSYSADLCGSRINFQNLSLGVGLYSWSFGDGSTSNLANPAHDFLPGTYTVSLLINENSECADSLQQTIVITTAVQSMIIPNVFTPNGDKVNDEFKISGLLSCKNYNLLIYNRWGQLVFETDSPSTTFWNGLNGDKKEIIEGVYFYILQMTETDNSDSITGVVTVLR